ncbi:MAG: urease accessory protein UreD [Paracoccaceae bacterium]
MRDLADMGLEHQPRALGQISITTSVKRKSSGLDDLYQKGCLKALFPDRNDHVEAVLINTSGGITGGDRLDVKAHAKRNAHMVISTQACERVYRAQANSIGKVNTGLTVSDGAMLAWLPQETIFFDGGQLERRLTLNLEKSARALVIESVLFGRLAMGETQINGHFRDRIDVSIDGDLVYRDTTLLAGDITSKLARPAVASGMRAMATLLYRAPEAAGYHAQLAAHLNPTSGSTLLAKDFLALRFLASDGQELRKMMLPILDLFTRNTLPKCWRL